MNWSIITDRSKSGINFIWVARAHWLVNPNARCFRYPRAFSLCLSAKYAKSWPMGHPLSRETQKIIVLRRRRFELTIPNLLLGVPPESSVAAQLFPQNLIRVVQNFSALTGYKTHSVRVPKNDRCYDICTPYAKYAKSFLIWLLYLSTYDTKQPDDNCFHRRVLQFLPFTFGWRDLMIRKKGPLSIDRCGSTKLRSECDLREL